MNMFVMEHITFTSHINLSYRILSCRLSSKHYSALFCEKNLSQQSIQQNIFPLIFAFIKRSCTLSFCRKNNFWISFMIGLYCEKLPIVYLILLFLTISHWIAGAKKWFSDVCNNGPWTKKKSKKRSCVVNRKFHL